MPPALMWAPGESAAEIKDRKPRQSSCSWWHHPEKALMLAAYPPEDTPALHLRSRIARPHPHLSKNCKRRPLAPLQGGPATCTVVWTSGCFTLLVLSSLLTSLPLTGRQSWSGCFACSGIWTRSWFVRN
jgi:hypothetical protein